MIFMGNTLSYACLQKEFKKKCKRKKHKGKKKNNEKQMKRINKFRINKFLRKLDVVLNANLISLSF